MYNNQIMTINRPKRQNRGWHPPYAMIGPWQVCLAPNSDGSNFFILAALQGMTFMETGGNTSS